jgi:competence protein ComFC
VEGATPKGGFAWPPRAEGVEACAVPAQQVIEAKPARLCIAKSPSSTRQRFREIERVWLGLSTPPLAERMAEHRWAVDEPGAYCQRCGSTVGPHDADDTGCSGCRGKRLPWERLVRLGEYDGLLRTMVHEVKFTRWRRLGDDLGRMLGQAVREVAEAERVLPADLLVTPVPASFRRRMYRGIDHALVVARGVAAELDCRVTRMLERRHRPSQTALPVSERAANVAGAFRRRSRGTVDEAGKVVVLVDDVTTTRATLKAACRGLADGLTRGAGSGDGGRIRMWGAVLAVTPDPRRGGPRTGGSGTAQVWPGGGKP